jgi:O-antigen ligase
VAATLAIAGVIGLAVLPSATLKRLMLLNVEEPTIGSNVDYGAIDSSMERKELLKRSLLETIKHPIFGLGAGQFAVAVAGEKLKKGEWAPWLGTHNSYTQVSSECGIPALICYLAVILTCLRLNYRMYVTCRKVPALSHIGNISQTLFMALAVHSVCTFFFHAAYTGSLPAMSGITVALYLSARPLLEQHAQKETQADEAPSNASRWQLPFLQRPAIQLRNPAP